MWAGTGWCGVLWQRYGKDVSMGFEKVSLQKGGG